MKKYIIGIDLGGTNIKASIFDDNYNCLRKITEPTQPEEGPMFVLNQILKLIEELLQALQITEKQIKCAGIGIPGLLDPDNGKSLFSPNFKNWENINVTEIINYRYNFKVYIDNDVRVNLYGEWLFGVGKNYKNIVLITIGTGLGAGVVIDGKMLYGTTSSVGEIGHMNIVREGRPCKCGSNGCLGRYVSGIGMVNSVIEKLRLGKNSIINEWANNDYSKITAQMISEAYDLKDKLAIEVMKETGEIFGFGLVNVINLFNPEIIIVGGGVSNAGDRLLQSAREIINRLALKVSREACKLVQTTLGDSAGMIGAAVYATKRLQGEII